MAAAKIDVARLADTIGVDQKTAHRWMRGQVPHPRHRWAIADLLNVHEDYLWPPLEPGVHPGAGTGISDQLAEILAAYSRRADVPTGIWWQRFLAAQQHIDLLGYALHFLPEQLPDLISLLIAKAEQGCQIRLALGDPASRCVRERDAEEGLGGTLPAHIRVTLQCFRALRGCPNIDIRLHAVPLYNSVFRWDDELFVTPQLYGTHSSRAPVFHLRRLGPHGLFANFLTHVDAIWAVARPWTAASRDRRERQREPA